MIGRPYVGPRPVWPAVVPNARTEVHLSGRVTLSEDRLVRTEGDRRDETALANDAAILDAYRTLFGIGLLRVPRIQSR